MNAKSYRVARLGLFIIFFVAISAVQCIIQRDTAFAKENIISVSSETELINAVATATSTNPITIQLSNDITYAANDGFAIPEGDITIDYNGHKISTANSKYLINKVPSGASLTLVNAEMTNIHDSVIGDNYGSITFKSTAGEGIKTTAEASCEWQELDLDSGIWGYVCSPESDIVVRNYGDIRFINGKYISSSNAIIGYSYTGSITFDDGYYEGFNQIIHIINDTAITVNNGNFIATNDYAFDYIYNSNITFRNGEITSGYSCFYVEDNDSNDHTTITIYGGTFEALNDSVIYNFADSGGTSTLNIYGGDFINHNYQTIYNDAYDGGGTAITNIYGGTFKFESSAENDYGYPVVYNRAFDGSTAIVNLLGKATFETNSTTSSAFEIVGNAQANISPSYYATPEDFLTVRTNRVQILPRTFNVTYLPGTTDTVTNMPMNDTNTSGTAYSVSATIPQREGYEFIGWELDYGTTTSYTVRYLKEGTEVRVADDKIVYNRPVDTTVTEAAIDVGKSFTLVSDGSQSKTLVQDAKENIITFYYAQAERHFTPHAGHPTMVDYITDEPYIVHHRTLTGIELDTDSGTALAGEPLTVYSRGGYFGLSPLSPLELTQETVPCNHVLEYQEFEVFDDDWYRFIPGNETNLQIDGLQQQIIVAKKGDTYTIWTRDQLSEEEQVAIYESFKANVYGMSDAKYANCQFMYADGSTLNGITVTGDYISLDYLDDWSIAFGSYLPGYEKIYEKGGDTLEFTFFYASSARR